MTGSIRDHCSSDKSLRYGVRSLTPPPQQATGCGPADSARTHTIRRRQNLSNIHEPPSEVEVILYRLRAGASGCPTCGYAEAGRRRHEAAAVKHTAAMLAAGFDPLEPYPGSGMPWRCRHLAAGTSSRRGRSASVAAEWGARSARRRAVGSSSRSVQAEPSEPRPTCGRSGSNRSSRTPTAGPPGAAAAPRAGIWALLDCRTFAN